MRIIIHPAPHNMYFAKHGEHTTYGVSPRQALQRIADKANLHGSTVEVSVLAPCKARFALRRAFPLASN